MKKYAGLLLVLSILGIHSFAQEKRISVHDPVMIRENGVYYLFATGMGVSVFSSTDMKAWKREKPVFSEPPVWAVETVPTYRGHTWAPDIYYHKGEYYLYYSVSAFGKNTSAIGVATNKTLDPNSPDFKWVDHGKVIQSYPGVTNWNAIDPNLIFDDKGVPWFSYGSFWDGLQLVPLNPDLKTIPEGKEPVTFASRKPDPNMENPPSIDNNPVDAGGNAIEAPFIFRKGKYFYLFASIDYCCKGVNSTYKMIIGRSENVQGPYLDKEGRSLRTGGGSILMQGDENWHGVGHNAVARFDGTDYLIFHAYDAADNGRSKLRIFELDWDEKGWPYPGKEVY
jgi:arabinan endo-1,5-alpha-L-arabinosidase